MSEIITRGNFLKGGIATILASGVAPSILMADSRSAGSIGGLLGSANGGVARGMMRNVGARQAAMFGRVIRKAEHYGIELVNGCQLNGTILSNFGNGSSYGKIPYAFSRDENYQEYVIELNLNDSYAGDSFGCFSYIGGFDGFTPFYQEIDKGPSFFVSWLSSNGSSWNLWSGEINNIPIRWGNTQRLKAVYDNGTYYFYEWIDGWVLRKSEVRPNSATKSGLYWQFGSNRGQNRPCQGTINLDKCYIINGDKLWWEFQPGSYERANGLI